MTLDQQIDERIREICPSLSEIDASWIEYKLRLGYVWMIREHLGPHPVCDFIDPKYITGFTN